MLTDELADCNQARWELVRILLGEHATGDIVERHKECEAEASRLDLLECQLRLQRHDWTHMMSDDPGVYKRGSEEQRWLEDQAKRSDDHLKIFNRAKKRAGAKAGLDGPGDNVASGSKCQ